MLIPHTFRVEKYRPEKLEDLVSHEDITSTSELLVACNTVIPAKWFANGVHCTSSNFYRRKSITTPPLLWTTRNW
jgi:hypothetical protein